MTRLIVDGVTYSVYELQQEKRGFHWQDLMHDNESILFFESKDDALYWATLWRMKHHYKKRNVFFEKEKAS